MFEYKNYFGFQFVKAGIFYLADVPWEGKGKKGPWEVWASLKMIAKRFREADETAYLIFSGSDLKYVGEYTYSLEYRWLKKDEDYVKHEKYLNIEKDISDGNEVSIWLAVSPYYETDKIKLNISKSLEHEIIRHYSPEWNKRNKTKEWEDRGNRIYPKVSEIVKSP